MYKFGFFNISKRGRKIIQYQNQISLKTFLLDWNHRLLHITQQKLYSVPDYTLVPLKHKKIHILAHGN